MDILFIGGIGTSEILLIVFVLLLLFGGKKLPELMRGMGRGIRDFKDAVNEPVEEIKKSIEE
ncbi:MAG: twin-arginine translocase TatA/TatE family subunit [Alistipes sp.]|nr:twin-arginine translocase TatA/TatE family subunit [Alistipes sp.]MBQ8437430.1 twin-arginine translocase TatA/TatE family subunit [Alistipes sp.]MBQ8553118.1 twin-arginine translocase TatA/TatE family subunit [Alistipes sp.]MBR3774840.1 twin-arginine translocase TatA/TatE family subunit [Alistipes sp.]MBR3887318.1 twin-arginine translocase TatA/TatE family subunit [Alistipes sp.]